MLFLETVFLCAIAMNFLTSYTDEFTGNHIKDLSKIADRYLNNNFIFDFITIFPFSLMFRFKFSRLLILIKCLRLVNLKHALDVNTVMA
jgi:hypothetical protein